MIQVHTSSRALFARGLSLELVVQVSDVCAVVLPPVHLQGLLWKQLYGRLLVRWYEI